MREMGLWTACGLIVAWIGCFTLFPALQSLLRTPMRSEHVPAGKWFPGFVDALVPASRRYRWPLVGGALALMLCGAAALFGIPGMLAPLALEMDVLTYVNPSERVAQDTRHFEAVERARCRRAVAADAARPCVGPGLPARPGAVDPTGSKAIRASPPSTARPRCCAGRAMSKPDPISCPTAAAAWPKLAADLEQIMLTEPGARKYVDVTDLANVRLSIRGRAKLFGPSRRDAHLRRAHLGRGAGGRPGAARRARQVVGKGVLGAEITQRLLPTLTESFALTASVIFLAFLLVFRSPSARADDDDSVVVRDPVRVSGDALDGHSAQYRHHPHRLDRAGRDRKRSDSFLLSFSGRPLDRHDRRRPATRHAGGRPARFYSRLSSMPAAFWRSCSRTCRRCASSASSPPRPLSSRCWPISPRCRARCGS